MDVDTDYTPNVHTNERKDVNMDSDSDVSKEASTNADVGGVNMGVIVNDSTLAKEPINTNEETVGNMNVGIDTSMEKDKYLARSMRRLDKPSDLGIDPHELPRTWEFIPTDKVEDTGFPGPDGAFLWMKEAYGIPNAQPFLYGGDLFNLADGGDGHYYYWNRLYSATIRIELTDLHEILAGIREEGALGIPYTILGYC